MALTRPRAGAYPRAGLKPRNLLLLGAALGVAGCAGAGPAASSPRNTLGAFRAAIGRNDLAAVYALLPPRARRAEPFDRFRQRMTADRRELADLGATIDRALADRQTPNVEVPLTGGGSATAVEDTSGWRLSRPGFGPVTAATPRDAARALHSALVLQNLPGLLEVLSARARGSMQADMQSLIEALRDPSGLDVVQISTQRVEIHLPDGRSIVMVREGNGWRVDDIQ